MSRIFGEVRQIAFVVKDFDAGLRYWSEMLGVGPFYAIRRLAPERYRYYGREVEPPCISLAVAFSGGVQVEVIEQHDERESAYRDFLRSGREGFHHVSSWLTPEDYDASRARLLEGGSEIAHEGAIPGSGIRFAYFATHSAPGGLYYEMADVLAPAFYPIMQRIEAEGRSWDGGDPVRDFAALV